jgi:predicted nucleic acid-binding Zn ribbon protein
MNNFNNNQEFYDFSVNLVVVPVKDIVERMKEHHIKLPLFAYRFLLKETIRDEVFDEKRFESYTDELQYRLRNYDDYSIYLLEKLIHKYDLEFNLPKFKEMLFNFLYLNRNTKDIDKSFFDQIISLKDEYELEVERLDYDTFYQMFENRLYQTIGYIDGIHSNEWTDETLTSHTLGDLKELGQKYGIKVPRRINKNRLIEILSAKLRLTDEEVDLLSKKSILDIEIYAKERGFRISTDLKKRDMIEFIKFSLGMYHKEIPLDEFDYGIAIPTIEDDLSEDIEDIEEDVEEQVDQADEELETETPVEQVDELEEEIAIEETENIEEEIVEEPAKETSPEEKPQEKQEEPKKKEVKEEKIKEESLPTDLADSDLLTEEEKELLDEKIAFIIRKYHKKKKRRKIFKIIFWTLFILILAFAVYSYIHYTYIDEGNLPFNIPIFW